MIYEILKDLLSQCIVYVPSLDLNLLLLIIVLFVFRLGLKTYFDKDPDILLQLFLHQATSVHEDCLDCFLL